MHVVIVQPGLIRTEFASAAVGGIEQEEAGDGPYAEFNSKVAAATKETYEKGPLAKLGGEPIAVAKSIETAITAKKPKIRYRVTPSARVLITQRSLMTDGMWDRMMRTQFPQPGAS